jgi:hypothetical protein
MEKVERARNSVAYRPAAPAPIAAERARPLSEYAKAAAINHDLLLLLERAEAIGFSAARASAIRDRLAKDPAPSAEEALQVESKLRAWVVRHTRQRATR